MRRSNDPRDTNLDIALTDDEKALLAEVAHGSDLHVAAWAREVLLTRAMSVRRQRQLLAA